MLFLLIRKKPSLFSQVSDSMEHAKLALRILIDLANDESEVHHSMLSERNYWDRVSAVFRGYFVLT